MIRYITIEREYGSGGTKIARQLSEETGIACYGREILEAVAKRQGLSVDEVTHYEETASGSFLYTIYAMAQMSTGNADMLSKEGHVYLAEQEEIQKMAHNGKAIFLGHCASEALRNESGVLKVYIRCSDETEKKKRIMEEYHIPERDVERVQKRFDKKRANYYYVNTMRRWEDMNQYDLVIDSATIGIDGCVRILKSLLLP